MAGEIKFVKRGQALAATVTEDDLAAHEWGGESPEPLAKVRVQDLELPHEVNVLYINQGADYQQGTQKSERQTGSGVSVMSIPLPVVMDDTKAKQVADVNHYNIWVGRTTYTLQLSRKWSKLEPTDVIDITYNDTTYRMRITKKDDAKPGILTFQCVAEDSEIYTQSGTGAGSSNIPTQVVTIPVQTLGMFLDIPMLRDEDNDAGLYFAACGYRAGWDGCVLFKSNDGGSTYAQSFSLNDQSAIGYSTDILGNFYGGNVFDELNTVTVEMMAGTLSSVSELLVLNGSNYAVLGNEVIQFKNAELVSTGVYKLSGLLRGRRGTEWAVSQHYIGERFVFASVATWRRVVLQTSDIGLVRMFKYPTFGMTLQQVAPTLVTPAGVALECYSPVEVGAGRNVDGDLTINWKRRNRIAGEWRDYVDVPMSESVESYEIDILDDTATTVVRTITASTETASYSAINQAADFPDGFPYTVNMNVYQLSAIVGRGYQAFATFDLPHVFSSTQWRIYVTERGNPIYGPRISELEMMITVGGSDQCTGGTTSANAGVPADAFDNNNTTYWLGNNTDPNWLQYTHSSSVAVVQYAVTISDHTLRTPISWLFQFYNGSSWVTVHSVTGETWSSSYERKVYTI